MPGSKITIVTVCYNAQATIADTLASIRLQGVSPEVEYIVVDGSSSDGTLDILNKNIDIINHLVSEHDKGIADAINAARSSADKLATSP